MRLLTNEIVVGQSVGGLIRGNSPERMPAVAMVGLTLKISDSSGL